MYNDFSQQLEQIREQIQSMKPQPMDSTQCPYRLPCGLCSKTNSFCGMNMEEKKDD